MADHPYLGQQRKTYTEIVELLLAQAGVEADIIDRDGRTPLSQASVNGHTVTINIGMCRTTRANTPGFY